MAGVSLPPISRSMPCLTVRVTREVDCKRIMDVREWRAMKERKKVEAEERAAYRKAAASAGTPLPPKAVGGPSFLERPQPSKNELEKMLGSELQALKRRNRARRMVQQSASAVALQTLRTKNARCASDIKRGLEDMKGWGPEVRRSVFAVQPATDEQVLQASQVLNAGMERHFAGEMMSPLMMWFKLFKLVDDDGSGIISYQEMVRMVRELLRIEPKELPLSLLNATWRVIDDDGSGQLTAGEFGKFMRIGMAPVTVTPQKPRVNALDASERALRLRDPVAERKLLVQESADRSRRWQDEEDRLAETLSRLQEQQMAATLELQAERKQERRSKGSVGFRDGQGQGRGGGGGGAGATGRGLDVSVNVGKVSVGDMRASGAMRASPVLR